MVIDVHLNVNGNILNTLGLITREVINVLKPFICNASSKQVY